MKMKPFFRLFTELSSRKCISKLTGSFAKTSLSKMLIPYFIKTYQIQVDEAEKTISEYRSLNEFFTRKLKHGARSIDEAPSSLISPVDAMIMGIGQFRDGEKMMIKGQHYSASELLNESPRIVNYKNGIYIVLYLSPADYHRIHAPVSGKIMEKDAVQGKVYPVHDTSLKYMKKVLSRNERLITYIAHEFGEIAVVKVGAMNVSSIRYAEPLPDTVEKGEELATFEFGSTVVLCMEHGTFKPRIELKEGDHVQMGQPLGILHPKHGRNDDVEQ